VVAVLGTISSFLFAASAQAQTVTASCDTPPSQRDACNRWYTSGSVILNWAWDPPSASTTGCGGGVVFAAEGRVERSCKVDWADTSVTKKIWIGIDRTPPQVLAPAPGRPPDYNGWFNHPVELAFQGVDATSGVASCSRTTYSGPEGAGVMVSGTCQDVAGHVGLGAFPLNYDATPPASPGLEALPGNRRVALKWSAASDSTAVVRRIGPRRSRVVYFGARSKYTDRKLRNGRRYRYIVTLIDQAGNQAVDRAKAAPTGSPLLSPARGARVRSAPLLIWKSVRRASYYNVQLVRYGKKVLSRWPRVARLQLRRSWRFGGKRRQLAPGPYCWYVWPGIGSISERRYGRRLGKSCFTIIK
jgi:hypothetical protein